MVLSSLISSLGLQELTFSGTIISHLFPRAAGVDFQQYEHLSSLTLGAAGVDFQQYERLSSLTLRATGVDFQ